MKDFRLEIPAKCDDRDRFAMLPDGIYRDLSDPDPNCYRVALSFLAEEGEGQYPLEDVLDEFCVYLSETLEQGGPGERTTLELGGTLKWVRKAATLIGRRAYNEPFTRDGRQYERLVID